MEGVLFMKSIKSDILFASANPNKMDREATLPARFQRLLQQLSIIDKVKGRTVAIKMHLGGGLGYSTIHPLFVRLLVDHIKSGKPKRVFVSDSSVKGVEIRGYTKETIGAPLVSAIGEDGKNVKLRRTGWDRIKSVYIGNPIANADVLIDLSHVKAHGDCGFGGACKNLAMGCVPGKTRRKIHELEGCLTWKRNKCVHCNKCIEECPTKANSFNSKGEYSIFWHHCTLCRHCALICPTKAITIEKQEFDVFQEGLARVAKLVLDCFKPKDVFFINFLTHITVFCDCWGLTTPALVPDIGIFAGQDIVAVDWASLDAIKTKNLIPGSLTPPFKINRKKGHLFEKIHHRDPYSQLRALEKLGAGSSKFKITEVK